MENTTAAVLPTASFKCTEGSSNKQYHMQVKEVDGGFQVAYQYGPIGGTLTPGSKPAKPVPLEKAIKQFESMVKERLGKQYVRTDSVDAPAVVAVERVSFGTLPQLLNAVDEADVPTLLADPSWFMQEKKDGKRLMARRIGDQVTAGNKLGLTCPIPEAVKAALLALPVTSVLLDCELVGNTLFVFDMLELNGVDQSGGSVVTRYTAYQRLLAQHDGVLKPVDGFFSPQDKAEQYAKADRTRIEGFVFKRADAPYTPGRPNSGGTQLKFKFTESATCIVDEVSDTRRSVALALLDDRGERVFVGNVTVPANQSTPVEGDLVEVRYLYRQEGGSLIQPVLLGQRDDVAFDDCKLSQIRRIKEKAADND
ncbi:WGR domain-containing protein [Noviherbaspirillum galbum]|uniref:WGR domain-containing protein n=1 Tax=Noviherbaspirillum galbum TaxID=2709383 RepID=A0A6B3SGZ5_9BURK|nr:WGR domain-containing protein [Noviherbaspirillum galbum]NEX60121.1 WGR domain-containing protein [Noviherbaspirillum galbum]